MVSLPRRAEARKEFTPKRYGCNRLKFRFKFHRFTPHPSAFGCHIPRRGERHSEGIASVSNREARCKANACSRGVRLKLAGARRIAQQCFLPSADEPPTPPSRREALRGRGEGARERSLRPNDIGARKLLYAIPPHQSATRADSFPSRGSLTKRLRFNEQRVSGARGARGRRGRLRLRALPWSSGRSRRPRRSLLPPLCRSVRRVAGA